VAICLGLLASLSACAAQGSPEPLPSITGTPPAAAAYDTAGALYEALSAAADQLPPGQLSVQSLTTGSFSFPMPAGAQKADFVVLGLEPEQYRVLAAVYAQPSDRSEGAAAGRRLAERTGKAVWQLEGPNWAAWATHKMPLFMLQWTIGGTLTQVVTSPSPSAAGGS
jgi:hypothetical protein